MTASIVKLGKDETWFWSTEPRVVIHLIEEQKRIERETIKAQSMYIACCVWGKIPNEIEDKEEPIPGIDVPVDSSALRGFL